MALNSGLFFSSTHGKSSVAEPCKGDWHWVAACRQGPLETAPPWPEHDIWLMLVQSPFLQHQILSPCELPCPTDPRQLPWVV